jgi:UDP-N-acetylmuramoyl-L-alanyl-D-glutamate--2,6-diaminopimelate ligase
MKLSELLDKRRIRNFREVDIEGITHDSRRVKENYLFVAVRGRERDGHDYIKDAEDRRASALVVERDIETKLPYAIFENTRLLLPELSAKFYNYPANSLKLIGITGTNGKTTISYMIKTCLDDLDIKSGLLGTIWYDLCGERIKSSLTTPEAPDLHYYLRRMVEGGGEYAVLEVSSHGIAEHRIDGILFDVAIFTNLQRDHLDYHGSIEEYRETKGSLFKEHIKGEGWAVINLDDPSSQYFLSLPRRSITYAIDKDADIRGRIIETSLKGTRFSLEGRVKGEIYLKVIGKHNVYNSLATIAALTLLGHPSESVIKALENFSGVPGRFERVTPIDYPFHVFVDYAHTPEAFTNILNALRRLNPKRIIILFGAGGDRDKGKRPLMARVAESLADYVVITMDNPRTEDPLSIIGDIERGFSKKNYRVILDRKEAIFWVIKNAREGDIIVLAGKGHENYQIVGNKKIPFDDREVAREALREVEV